MAERFSETVGRPVKIEIPVMLEGSVLDEEQLASKRFFTDKAYTADINPLRGINPDLLDFTAWVQRTGWANN